MNTLESVVHRKRLRLRGLQRKLLESTKDRVIGTVGKVGALGMLDAVIEGRCPDAFETKGTGRRAQNKYRAFGRVLGSLPDHVFGLAG